MKNYRFLFAVFFLEILPKFSDFVNSVYDIGKITSSEYAQFLLKNDLKLIKIRFFLVKK